MITAIEAHNIIAERAIKRPQQTIEMKSMKIGQWVRQGDIYIIRIKKITGTVEAKSRQLAIGTTKGSRHIVSDNPKNRLIIGYSGIEIPDTIKGPQIEALEVVHITHPEHDNWILPAGCYQSRTQLDFKTQQRVRD